MEIWFIEDYEYFIHGPWNSRHELWVIHEWTKLMIRTKVERNFITWRPMKTLPDAWVYNTK